MGFGIIISPGASTKSIQGGLFLRNGAGRSPSHTQPGRSAASGCAFRPVRGAAGAHEAGKNLSIRTGHAIRSSDDANCG
jgi:hypothetical protein